jgi:hypothetical protein
MLTSPTIELLGGSLAATTVFHLPLCDHVHELDTAQQNAGTTKALEPEHRPGTALDSPVVLVDDVVQILVLADLDRRVALRVEGLERCQIRTTFIDCDRRGLAVLIDRLLEVALGRSLVTVGTQQEIDRLPALSTARYKYFQWPLTLM